MTKIYHCDFCKNELKGKFYKVEDREIDKDGILVEYNTIFFVCKNCMNEGSW